MHLEVRLLAVAAVLVAFLVGSASVAAPPARADVCDAIPSLPGVPNPAKMGCKVVGGAASKGPDLLKHPGKAAADIATAPIRAAGDAVMQGVTTWVAKGAAWLVGEAGKLVGNTTSPRIGSTWFLEQYRRMGALAAIFALPLLLLSVLQGVLRRDGGVIVRAAFVQLPLAFLLAAIAVTVVQLLLQLTDQMSGSVASSVGSDAERFFKDTGKALTKVFNASGGSPVPLFAVFLGGLIAAAGSFCVWVELLIRSAAIYAAVLFLPFTFVAMIWPATTRWCKRLIEILLAIIFAKFVIVAIMALAAAGLGHSRSHEAFQGVMAGAALMLLAAFSPFVLLRLIPFAESAVVGSGWRRGGFVGYMLAPALTPGAVMRRAAYSNWGSHGGHGAVPSSPVGGRAAAAAMSAGGSGSTSGGGMRVARSAEPASPRGATSGGAAGVQRPATGSSPSSTATLDVAPPPRPETVEPPESPQPRPRDRERGLDDV